MGTLSDNTETELARLTRLPCGLPYGFGGMYDRRGAGWTKIPNI